MIMANSRCTCSCPFHDSNGVLRQLKWTNHGGTLFVEELVTCQSRKRFSAETAHMDEAISGVCSGLVDASRPRQGMGPRWCGAGTKVCVAVNYAVNWPFDHEPCT